VCAVPTSEASRKLAQQAGITLVDFDRVTQLDLTIDGADETDADLNLIKGGGGALLREKIVASLSRRVVIIVDAGKRVEHLGVFPLPVEVVQFAWRPIAERIGRIGGVPRLRRADGGEPFVTDEGNYILDCAFGAIDQPRALAETLNGMPGVMEHGLFVDLADVVIVGQESEVLVLER
jgi:ribose 5-phosphate isomerase A